MLTALAGPLMNIIVAFVFSLIFYTVAAFAGTGAGTIAQTAILMIYYVVVVNVSLAVFNLIPVPPLDGSKIFGGFLPYKYQYKMEEYQNIITIIMMLLLFTGVLGAIISPVSEFLIGLIDSAARFIVGSVLS
ncbi:MAG: site-2 protease family protein [Clostridia bacterium]|nr:site-2 protease family protein [Clostridia bacterium]